MRRLTVEVVENGFVVIVEFMDGALEQHVATNQAKLKKLIKAALETKETQNAN